jgi:hypothetical protein
MNNPQRKDFHKFLAVRSYSVDWREKSYRTDLVGFNRTKSFLQDQLGKGKLARQNTKNWKTDQLYDKKIEYRVQLKMSNKLTEKILEQDLGQVLADIK